MKPVKETWSAFDRFQKAVLCVLAAMVLLFGVLTAVSRSQPGVLFHDTLLGISASAEATVYSGKSHGAPVTITVTRESGTETRVRLRIGDLIDDNCLVEYPLAPVQTEFSGQIPGLRITKNGAVLFEGGYDPADYHEITGYRLYDLNGQLTPGSATGHTYGGGSNYWRYYETSAGTILRFANGPEQVCRGSWLLFTLTTLLALLAAAEAAFPLQLFRLRHRWYVQDPEPTEFYYSMTRLSCVLVSIFVLISYIFALRQLP